MKVKQSKGITLIALVITIIVLLILVGVAISMLTGENGILKMAEKAKVESEIAKVEELGKLELDKVSIDGLGQVEDATAQTAVMAYLGEQGYKCESVSTTTETINGILIKDDKGKNIDEIGLLQGKNKSIKVALDTEGETNSKNYVTILGKQYELIVNKNEVKVSREEYKKPVSGENGYEIKLTPSTSGIEIKAGNKTITQETTVTPETEITIQAKEEKGTFKFNVKESKTSTSRDVNVVVNENPEYATGITVRTKNNAETTVETGKTVELEAILTPSSSTDTVKWSIQSGEAEVDGYGVVTVNKNATDKSEIVVLAKCERADKTETTVQQTITLTVKKALGTGDAQVMTNAKAAMPEGAHIDESTNSDTGIVMIDSNQNEWVWIEVPSTVFKNASYSTDYDNIKQDLVEYASDYRCYDWDDDWSEYGEYVYESGSDIFHPYDMYEAIGISSIEEYNYKYQEMLNSIYTNKGFYIGRYEAGIAGSDEDTSLARYDRTKITSSSPKAVSKKDMIPYNYVYCSDAQQLANEMVTGNKTSSLLFGIQWDLVCKFLEVKGNWDTTTNTAQYYIKENSTSWGNYYNSKFTINSANAKKYNSRFSSYNDITGEKSNHILLTTGASEQNKKMNIYDFAGNEWEWTLETLEKGSNTSTSSFRGGYYDDYGSAYPASDRSNNTTDYRFGGIGLRVSLY